MGWFFGTKGASGFSSSSTAEEVTEGIDGSGLTAIVTGASSGIGRETARVLALRGVHVVMGVRNLSAGNHVKEAIVKENPSAKLDVMELDLSAMASVKKFASEFTSLNLPLNILINNAGVTTPPFTLSQNDIELHFATNHVGHFLLTHLLLENMKNAAQKGNIEGRIVNLSSMAHKFTYHEGIRFDRISDKSGYSCIFAYGQAKLANILHAIYVLKQEEGVKITANSVHPGGVVTNIFRDLGFLNGLITSLGKYVLKNVQQALFYESKMMQGVATTCYVALQPQVRGVTGKYFADCNIAEPDSRASSADLAKKPWDLSLEMIR